VTSRAVIEQPDAPVDLRQEEAAIIRRGLVASYVRETGLVAALIVVWILFQFTTDGIFLTPRNLSNLSVQFAVTAILAVGIVVVMSSAEIDLSAGATVGLCGIFVAQLTSNLGVAVPLAIGLTLILGLLIGVWHAVWVVVGHVPSFITTLASLLGLGGVALVITDGQTIPTPNGLSFAANSYLPGWTVLVFGALAIATVVTLGGREVKLRRVAGLDASRFTVMALPVISVVVVAAFAAWVFLSYQGLPFPVLILGIVFAVVAFMMRYTVFGKHVISVGTDREASRRAGLRVGLIQAAPFVGMGLLYGVSGLIFASRLGGAPADGMVGEELNVIAAAVLGGTSLFGGVSRVGGAVIGALLMESLSNGLVLMNVSSFWQEIVVGAMLLLAVCVDVNLRRRQHGV
jgi:D-xylose transport system permease protein